MRNDTYRHDQLPCPSNFDPYPYEAWSNAIDLNADRIEEQFTKIAEYLCSDSNSDRDSANFIDSLSMALENQLLAMLGLENSAEPNPRTPSQMEVRAWAKRVAVFLLENESVDFDFDND